jgi:hypothetical protein
MDTESGHNLNHIRTFKEIVSVVVFIDSIITNKVGRVLRHLEMAKIDDFGSKDEFCVMPSKRIRGWNCSSWRH